MPTISSAPAPSGPTADRHDQAVVSRRRPPPHLPFAAMDRRWPGRTVAIVASGESARDAGVDALAGRLATIAVNDGACLAPWAELLYAADAAWWETHAGCAWFAGERWTTTAFEAPPLDTVHARRWGLSIIPCAKGAGVPSDPQWIWHGWHSGFQALGLAVLAGARRVLLVGFDCRGDHFFGRHPPGLERASPFDAWIEAYRTIAPELARVGVEAINCGLESGIDAFPKMPLRRALQ